MFWKELSLHQAPRGGVTTGLENNMLIPLVEKLLGNLGSHGLEQLMGRDKCMDAVQRAIVSIPM